MKKILIATKPDDTHALYVKLALEKKGHAATLWYTADYPEIQTHTFSFDGNEIVWRAAGLDFTVDNREQFDVVWLRRPSKPMIPSYLHEDDKANAKNENGELFKTMWRVICPDAVWVNPVESIRSVSSKLYQLKVAKEVGLQTPASLFSNDPDKIKEFIRSHHDSEVIYKPLYPVHWFGEDSVRLTYTNNITEALLPSDKVLQCTPGIYQKKIQKAYELRVTYFGDRYIAAKLNSQAHPKAKTDWRSVPCFEIEIEPYQLPSEVDIQCREFMKCMGILFGCFDLIVTPEGEYYFLEINEQGQFLWIEEANAEIKMLDAFADFMIGCAKGKVESNEVLSLSDFDMEVNQLLKAATAQHKVTGIMAS